MTERLQHFGIRAVAMSAIAIAFFLTLGFGTIAQTFLIGVAASAGSHAVLLAVLRLRGKPEASLRALGLFSIIAVAAALVVVFVAKGPQDIGMCYRTVDELMHYPGGQVGKPVKLHGFFAQHSRTKDGFVLEENGARVRVVYTGSWPEFLTDRAEVIATGRLRRDGAVSSEFHFLADEVIAKCPSTYNTPTGPRPAAEFR